MNPSLFLAHTPLAKEIKPMTGLVRKLAASTAVALFTLAVSAPASTVLAQGAPTGQKMEKPAMKKDMSAKKAAASKQLMAVQEALNAKGFKVKVDGKRGKETVSAIKKFQEQNGMKATGRADKATMEKLGVRT
jgi:peptidoglycan hydrolase-like protein with peptidoglycan-binding domain